MTDFDKIVVELENYLQNDLPVIIGTEAVNFFTDSFKNEGFTNKTLVKWQDVKRRLNARNRERAAASRPILTGSTGELGDSLIFKKHNNYVVISSDKDYAEAHNEGTTNAGRNRNIVISKRQFVGESQALNLLLSRIIEQDIKRIFNK